MHDTGKAEHKKAMMEYKLKFKKELNSEVS